MFLNYCKAAWRNMLKSRFYAGINVFGLSVGIAFTLLIAAYVWGEWQVNRHLKNAGHQYIIRNLWKGQVNGSITTFGPLARALKENYPALVANYYRWDGITTNVSTGSKAFREGIQIGDSTLLNMYGFKLVYGNASTALKAPFTVVITTDRAIKYFGRADVTGQTISIENMSGGRHDFLVTGVMEMPSKNSVTNINESNNNGVYVSDMNLGFFGRDMTWQNTAIVSYLELREGVSAKDLERPIARLVQLNAQPQDVQVYKPYLTPLKEYYLEYNNGFVKKTLFVLSFIAVFILMMAVINFINMSVSRSSSRLREIGVRKALGGSKQQLIVQFITESVVMVFFATMIALVVYSVTRELFAGIVGRALPGLFRFPAWFALFIPFLVVALGFLAGVYPAFVLSSVRSVESLKGKLSSVRDKVWLRKSLVTFQFAVAIIAFAGAVIISRQTDLFFSKSLGYNKDFVVSAQVPRNWTKAGVEKMETIRNQFAAMPGVSGVSLSFEIPNGYNIGGAPVYRLGEDSTRAIDASFLETDENYLSVYQIPVKAGAFFDDGNADSAKIVVNETALQQLGWKNENDAIGQQVRVSGDPTIFTVKGVIRDFHFGSMQGKIDPAVFFPVRFSPVYRYLSFKIQPQHISSTLNGLQGKWAALMPGAAFEYRFMDETLTSIYQSELQFKKAAYTATLLAMIIVLLGVFGLVTLNIRKRTKEIGIRKVLGSSVLDIIVLFTREFVWMLLMAGIIACPLAYMIMHSWLQGYAYRVSIGPLPFIAVAGFLALVTILLIAAQTMKAALENPVKSLRTE